MALDYVMNIEPTAGAGVADRLPVHGPRSNERAWPDTPVFNGYAAPVRSEGDTYELEVVGTIPPELDGAYVRNCADHQFPPMYRGDLFLNGDGMLHKVRIRDGHADLSTRYVQTPKYLAERKARKALFGAYRNPFSDDPAAAGIDRSTANTSVVYHAGKLLALKEASKPYRVDPQTLATIGIDDFAGALRSESFTAHPKIDPRTGEMVAYGYYTSGVPDKIVEMYYISPDGRLERTERFEAPYPSMIHDFMLSENYAIFTICPMTTDWEMLKQGWAIFHWDDRLPTMVGVVPRRPGGAASVRWFKAPKPVMETHTFNAWEEGSTLNLVHFVTETGWLSQFPDVNNADALEKPPFAYRWTIDLDSAGEIGVERMFGHVGEMPMIDLRYMTRPTRHYWFGTSNTDLGPMLPRGAKGPPFTCLGHFDRATGKVEYFYSGADSSPEEPIFVPRSPDAEEGDGWLMTMVGRRGENRTDFVILDARDLGAGPVATIKFPCRVHEGFHGIWIPGSAFADG